MRLIGLAVVLAVGLSLAPLAAEGQQSTNVPRIGMLMPVTEASAAANINAFRDGLRELGYIEGQNVALERRYSQGRTERLPAFAAELVRLRVEVIVTWGTPAALAAKKATTTIPIVMAAAIDPLGSGIIASLARPGGNITGLTSGGAELSGKTLELLREVVPKARRIAVLWNSANPVLSRMLSQTQVAAHALGLELQLLDVRDPKDFENAFQAMSREHAGALLVLNELLFLTHRQRIADLATRHRLASMYERREYVDAGGLMSYGVNFLGNFRRAAAFVDRILKGAKPGDLPVEDPARLEFVLNMRTAKALGLTIPQTLLQRADQVIQ